MRNLILGLMATGSLIATPNEFPMKDKPIIGFSESARFETRDPVGLSIYAFFNEFAASQDSNEVGYISSKVDSFYPQINTPQGSVVRFGNDYHPGFQVGFSVDTPLDKWNFAGEYLWYRGHSNKEVESAGSEYYISPLYIGTYAVSLSSIDADWRLALDLVDLYLTRPYYSGRKLTIEPVLGLKLGSIRQSYHMSSNVLNEDWESQTAAAKSRLLGIGPKLGCQSNYLMGKGFSIIGDLFTTLLYSRYTTIEASFANSIGQTSFIQNNNYGTVRPVLDAGIGLGWKGYFGMGTGDYSYHKTFYMSFSAAYNFSLFFSQNMEIGVVSIANSSQSTPGNLYLQGLSVGLDFIF